MPRRMQDRLVLARRHVEMAEEQCARQERVVAELLAQGRDHDAAARLLEQMRHARAQMQRHWEMLRQEAARERKEHGGG